MKKGKNNDEPLAGEDEEKVDGLMDLLLIRITSTTKDPFMASDVTQPQLCVSHHSRFKQSEERKKVEKSVGAAPYVAKRRKRQPFKEEEQRGAAVVIIKEKRESTPPL